MLDLFLTFVESLDIIFFWYKETCEVLLDCSKIGGEKIKEFAKKYIRNILHTNIDVHIRRLIFELPGYGINFIETLQSHYAKITFSGKSRYDQIHKGGVSAINYIDIFQNAQAF